MSSLLLPILSPPGLGIYPFPKRANNGPTIMIDPRRELPSRLNSRDSKYSKIYVVRLKSSMSFYASLFILTPKFP